jgi:hypothetical protein
MHLIVRLFCGGERKKHDNPPKMGKIGAQWRLVVGFVNGRFIWIETKPNKNGENHYKHNDIMEWSQFILVWGKHKNGKKNLKKTNQTREKFGKPKAEARCVRE